MSHRFFTNLHSYYRYAKIHTCAPKCTIVTLTHRTMGFLVNKYKQKTTDKMNINYNGIKIKQHSQVKYLGCILDGTLNGESMALKVLAKINSKLKFLYRKNKFLSHSLRRLLCNAMIQPHFDYACSAWYPNLNKAVKWNYR